MASEIQLLIFFLCILLSAFFSGSEVALLSITHAKVKTLLAKGGRSAQALADLKRSPDHIIITVLIANTLVNVAAASIATSLAIERFGNAGIGIATGVVVLILLVFGEIGPKMFAVRFTEPVALGVSPLIRFLATVFSPFIWIFDRLARSMELTKAFAKPAITEEEIKGWIELGQEDGTLEKEEQEMLFNVLEFGDTTAREVMTPRVNVMMIDEKDTLPHTVEIFKETGFSRLPVYSGEKGNVTGLLNVKEVFPVVLERREGVTIRDLMHEPYFAPETAKIDDLLKELQKRKVHMGFVLDEYGEFAGIITVEDILEELVGEILDEFDQDEPEIQTVEPGVYLIDGQVRVKDANDQLGISLPLEASYDTLGGLATDRLGHIPRRGDMVSIDGEEITITVIQMLGRRVGRVKLSVSRLPAAGEG
ncbi:MAG: hemolysin family protein [Methanomicrobiales archaeon]|nr:hemolysin family protein [Methanomicrobiales archaeon]MDD1662730.1 hemolysin family protein [Methanomicrobiales archaeon]